MGVSTREKDLLKLVHPGRKIEVYREPVPAADVMQKYPRHCLARPDVFRFPWIVVKPEAILLPGKVFYVVPYRTVYKLLKDRRQKNQHTPRHELVSGKNENDHQGPSDSSLDNYLPSHKLINDVAPTLQPMKNRESHQSNTLSSAFKKDWPLKIRENHSTVGQTTPIRSSAGRTPKHIHGESNKYSPWNRTRYEEEHSHSQSPHMPYYLGLTEVYQRKGLLSDDRSLDTSLSYSGRRRTNNKSRQQNSRRVHEVDNHHTRGGSSSSTSTRVQPKSCLRKPGSARRMQNTRVTFASSVFIPNQERESPTTLQHDDFPEF